jgi:hypothetical protein
MGAAGWEYGNLDGQTNFPGSGFTTYASGFVGEDKVRCLGDVMKGLGGDVGRCTANFVFMKSSCEVTYYDGDLSNAARATYSFKMEMLDSLDVGEKGLTLKDLLKSSKLLAQNWMLME